MEYKPVNEKNSLNATTQISLSMVVHGRHVHAILKQQHCMKMNLYSELI